MRERERERGGGEGERKREREREREREAGGRGKEGRELRTLEGISTFSSCSLDDGIAVTNII